MNNFKSCFRGSADFCLHLVINELCGLNLQFTFFFYVVSVFGVDSWLSVLEFASIPFAKITLVKSSFDFWLFRIDFCLLSERSFFNSKAVFVSIFFSFSIAGITSGAMFSDFVITFKESLPPSVVWSLHFIRGFRSDSRIQILSFLYRNNQENAS